MTRNSINRNLLLFLCSLALFLLCPAKNIFAQAASVLESSGGWYVEGGGNISRGTSLRSGALVKARSPESQTDYIVITNLSGKIIDRRYCRNEGSCNIPIRIPAPPVCGVLCRIYDSAMRAWYGDPVKFKNTGSQDIGKGLQEAVVSLNKKKIDLKSIFKQMPDGRYQIRFVEPPCQDLSNCKILFGPVDFQWSSKTPSLLLADKLSPGLYEVQLLKEDEDEPTGTGEAWILVSEARKFQALSAKFVEAVQVTKRWTAPSQSTNGGAENKIKNSTVRSFLRATLFYLSEQARTKTAMRKPHPRVNKALNSPPRKKR
jgi:hypothetical protein